MSLPFDPATVDPEDFGEQQATLEMDHEEAIQYVRAVCEEAGFGFPAEFSPSKMLNEKVDADREPYYVLGACNPKMADRALDATGGKIGALFPGNMVIWQAEPGLHRDYHVSIMKIARLLGMSTDDEELDDIIDETGKMVETVFEQLENKPA